MFMKKLIACLSIFMLSACSLLAKGRDTPLIEVSGSATLNIVPDRITIEIGMEEYFKHKADGDSTVVTLSEIEKKVRKTLREEGVPDSLVIVSDVGNYRDRNVSSIFLMAKRLSATLCDFSQLERISERLGRRGIVSFNITKIDNSDIEKYNRQGLREALNAARQKAELIAENEGLKLSMPYEIIETTNEGPAYQAFYNVAYNGGAGMEGMRRIIRRYTVKMRFLFNP